MRYQVAEQRQEMDRRARGGVYTHTGHSIKLGGPSRFHWQDDRLTNAWRGRSQAGWGRTLQTEERTTTKALRLECT